MNEQKEKKLTPWQVLRYKFPENEYVLIAEVSDASGFSRSRSLDYMLINLWESRGLAVTGIEKKSNRSDWLKELKTPQKQENHFKYCDYFYLLTDKEGVAKLEEIPESWGWYHINEKQILKTIKPAPKLNSIPINRSLLCAMLRRAATKEKYIHVDSIEEEISIRVENQLSFKKTREGRALEELDYLRKTVDEFEKASGLEITHPWTYNGSAKEFGAAVRVVLNGEVKEKIDSLKRIESMVKNIHEGLVNNIKVLSKVDSNGTPQ